MKTAEHTFLKCEALESKRIQTFGPSATSVEIGNLARYTMEESGGDKLKRKMEEAPLFPIGIAGCIIALGIGAYKYKHRGNLPTSAYLMQLRVAAQGTVVGCLALGIVYTMFKDYVLKDSNKNK